MHALELAVLRRAGQRRALDDDAELDQSNRQTTEATRARARERMAVVMSNRFGESVLDERTLERTNGYARVRADMTRLAEALSAANLHKSLV